MYSERDAMRLRGWVWKPSDADRKAASQPGCLIAWDFKPWRLITKDASKPREGEPTFTNYFHFQLRPPHLDPTLTAHAADLFLRGQDTLVVLHEHYGLCVHCGDLMPCHDREAARFAVLAMQEVRRYETVGICPACEEPITLAQKSETLPNVVSPLVASVTFHTGRRTCRYELERYRTRVDGTEPTTPG